MRSSDGDVIRKAARRTSGRSIGPCHLLRWMVAAAILAIPAAARAYPGWPRVPTKSEIETARTELLRSVSRPNEPCSDLGIVRTHVPRWLATPATAFFLYVTYSCETFTQVRDENGNLPADAKPKTFYYIARLRWDEGARHFTFSSPPASAYAMPGDMQIDMYWRAPVKTREEHETRLANITRPSAEGGSDQVLGWPGVVASKPLCPEVDFHFSKERLKAAGFETDEDRLSTNMKVDQNDLLSQFTAALAQYTEEYGASPTRSNNILGLIPAGSWLFAEGGVYEEHSRDFVFNRSMITTPKGGLKLGPVKRGTEPALLDAIVTLSEQDNPPRRLTPGDVFLLALRQRNGDAREALLLAHNTLRSLARNGDFVWTGIQPDPRFFDTYLADIRSQENAGPWYHLFGTAFFEMQSRGEWAPWMVVGMGERVYEGARDGAIGQTIDKIAGTEIAHGQEDGYISAVSTISNFAEQWGRESALAGRAPDPEKYCFNVWGARLGAMLHNALTANKTAKPPEVFRDAWDNVNWQGIKETPATLREWVSGWGIFSPVRLTMRGVNDSLMFDASTGEVTGSAPIMMTPFYEKDGSWAAWFQPLTKAQYTLTFEAVGDGTMHYATADYSTGQVAAWTLPVRRGDTFSGVAGPGALTAPLVRANGNRIVPAIGPLQKPTGPSFISTISGALSGGALMGQLRATVGGLDQTERILISVLVGIVVLIIFGLIARAKRRG